MTAAPKRPCLFPLPDGRRCCECDNCQGYDRPAASAQRDDDLRKRAEMWWDDAAECERVGAPRLAEICRKQAIRAEEERHAAA